MKVVFETEYVDFKQLMDDVVKMAYTDKLSERIEYLDKIRDTISNSLVIIKEEVKK